MDENWSYSFIFTDFGQVTVILSSLGKTLGRKKQFKPSYFHKKFKNHELDLTQVIFKNSISRDQELAGFPK